MHATKMNSSRTKRRALPTGAVVVALATAMATRMPAAAFMAIDTTLSRPHPMLSTKLFVKDGTSQGEELTMETINDQNYQTLLNPPSSPQRPILVDAFAPWCGPCKILDKVLHKAQPRYLDKVDFCRWNVNDKENTVELKNLFLDSEFTLTKLPSLIVFREGKPVAARAGLANEFQLDSFLEKALPDVLESTFDENGIKMLPLPEQMMVQKETGKIPKGRITHKTKNLQEEIVAKMAALSPSTSTAAAMVHQAAQIKPVEQIFWQNRTVIPAMDGILLPARS